MSSTRHVHRGNYLTSLASIHLSFQQKSLNAGIFNDWDSVVVKVITWRRTMAQLMRIIGGPLQNDKDWKLILNAISVLSIIYMIALFRPVMSSGVGRVWDHFAARRWWAPWRPL